MTAGPPLPFVPGRSLVGCFDNQERHNRSEQLDANLRDLDRWLASALDEPWRLTAPWFEGIAHPERPSPDYWVLM